jgi:adenosylcobinamide kinase / adenosylcobinamide-phosphate guanylyltransferase
MDWDGICPDEISRVEDNVKDEVDKLINVVKAAEIPFIIVTNELGMGVVPPYELGRAIRDIAGRANQMLAKAADEVHLCVSGIPVRIK